MLSFFKVNDPFRLLFVALLLVVFRLPFWLLEIPLLETELVWMLIGERMARGFSMYLDIIDDSGPFSAGIYWIIHLVFGKSSLVYQIAAGLLILFQIGYLNSLFIKYKSFEENTYIPALIMLVVFQISFDFHTLSPPLMGTTFVLLALGQLFSQTVIHQDSTESVLLVGLFGGIAVCFHFPLVVFFPFLLVSGITVSGFSFKQFLLAIIGYFLPFTVCALYYFWIDALPDLLTGFVLTTRIFDAYNHVSYMEILILFALPLIFTLTGIAIVSLSKRLTVNQQKQKQLIYLFLLFSVLSILLANRRTPYQLVIILPGITYLICNIFLYLQNKKLVNLLFYFFFLGIPVVGYFWYLSNLDFGKPNQYTIVEKEDYNFTKGKKILVLGNDIGYYQHAILATPYLNYNLSKKSLTDLGDYENLVSVYMDFDKDKPEFILDQEGIFARLLEHMPLLRDDYIEEKEGLYRLK